MLVLMFLFLPYLCISECKVRSTSLFILLYIQHLHPLVYILIGKLKKKKTIIRLQYNAYPKGIF